MITLICPSMPVPNWQCNMIEELRPRRGAQGLAL